jgi:hypothetical protein
MAQPTLAATVLLAGWLKLPNELKLHILRHALPDGETFDCEYFRVPRCRFDRDPNRCDTYVLPLLCIPDLTGLVTEVLYGQNTISILSYHQQN